eukprot:1930171-Amphidinium_carterae.1
MGRHLLGIDVVVAGQEDGRNLCRTWGLALCCVVNCSATPKDMPLSIFTTHLESTKPERAVLLQKCIAI